MSDKLTPRRAADDQNDHQDDIFKLKCAIAQQIDTL